MSEEERAYRRAHYRKYKDKLLPGNRARAIRWRKANPERHKANYRRWLDENRVAYNLARKMCVPIAVARGYVDG